MISADVSADVSPDVSPDVSGDISCDCIALHFALTPGNHSFCNMKLHHKKNEVPVHSLLVPGAGDVQSTIVGSLSEPDEPTAKRVLHKINQLISLYQCAVILYFSDLM